jgi:hypothetical protein
MKRSYLEIVLLSFFLASCAGLPALAQSGEPVFQITTKNKDDQVSIQYQNGIAFIDVHSPVGIGSATFELESGPMPAEIILRLHLKGLEEIRLTSSQNNIAASVASSDTSNINQRIIAPGSESPLLPNHPLWMQVEIISELPEKSIPLEEGYFKITMPKEFIQNAGNSYEIEWIDFYR